MKRFVGFVVLLFFFFVVQAQIVLKGNVHSTAGEVLPFFNVAVFSDADTTKLITGSMTDTRGNYIMSPVSTGKYCIVISGIGYRTLRETIQLRMPSVGNVIIKNYTIDEEATSLDEVIVKATRKSTYVDKSVYTFSKEQIKNARYSNDLLAGIGELSVDAMTNKISKMGGGSVKLLINGVNATDNDLKSIPPEKVLKVEYYDMPPARYATVGVLVNVITKRLDTGWNGGMDVSHAFTTGFGNDNLYLKYVAGNHQLSFDYELHYRNYGDRFVVDNYRYRLDGKAMDYLYNSHGKFGYTDNLINLKYTYDKPESYTFQATFSPNLSTKFANADSDIALCVDEAARERLGRNEMDIRTFGPTADVYFSKKLKRNQELSLNVVGTLYHNRQEEWNREWETVDGTLILEDKMNLCNDKQSLIGEVAYNNTWGLRTLSAGYKGMFASSNSTISNYLSGNRAYEYNSRNSSHYFYAEYGDNKNRFMYRIGVGGTWTGARNDDTRYFRFLFVPKVILSYKFKPTHNVQWLLTSAPSIPTISQLSNNAELITEGLLRRGNPYLQSSNTYITTLRYNWNTNWIDLNLSAVASYSVDPISTYYQEESINGKRYIVSTAENAESFWVYGGFCSFSIRPFKSELLRLKVYGMVLNQELNSPIVGRYTRWYIPLFYAVNFRKGNWGVSYNGNLVSRHLDGTYLKQDENQSNLQVFYQHRQWRFMAGCYWLFTKSRYYNATIPNDVLKHDSRSYINDNRSMITLGFSWNFSTGKKLDVKRKLQNEDTDKGTF